MGRRKAIPHAVELAAALLQLVDADSNRLVPHDHAKLMSADQVISLFQRDHYPIRKADGGPDEAWNLTWRLRADHKTKTAKIDQPQLGKQRRIRAREQEHQAALQAKIAPQIAMQKVTWPKPKMPSRPFPKGRGFAARNENRTKL